MMKKLFLILLLPTMIFANYKGIQHELVLDYRPPIVPISFSFEISEKGVKVKSMKYGLKDWNTPIGTFKISSKAKLSENNISIVFINKKTNYREEYIVPFKGEISVIADNTFVVSKGLAISE